MQVPLYPAPSLRLLTSGGEAQYSTAYVRRASLALTQLNSTRPLSSFFFFALAFPQIAGAVGCLMFVIMRRILVRKNVRKTIRL